MDDRELRRTLDRLTARIARLEREMGVDRVEIDSPASPAPPPAPTPAPAPPPAVPPPVVTASSTPAAPPSPKPTPAAPPTAPVAGSTGAPSSESLAEQLNRWRKEGGSRRPDRSATATARARSAAPAASSRSLEVSIGRFWMAIAAAFIIVLGVGFFVKYAYDAGWIGAIPPWARCLMAAMFGGALIGAGEIVIRRVGRVGALGLFGAGLATLYLTVYATFNLQVAGELAGLMLLSVVALGGFALTWRARSLSIGVLSIVGGYLTPLLLGDAPSFPSAFPLYLTMLLGVALGVSAVRAEPFRPLRYVALGAHGFLGMIWLGWVASTGAGHWGLMLAFTALWWGMVAAEAILAALREQSPVGNSVASLLSTAWFVTAGCWVLSTVVPAAGPDWLGLFTLGVGATAAAAALQFGPGLDGLRGIPRTAMDKLALALWAQAGILLAVAIALQFDDFGQSIAWLAVGFASVEIGRRLPSRGVSGFGLAVGALALLRIAVLDWHLPALSQVWFTVGEVTVTYWAILAAIAVVVTHVAALRLQEGGRESTGIGRTFIAAIATFGWVGVCAVIADGFVTTGGWLIGAAMLLGFERLGRRQHYAEIASIVIIGAAAKWLILDVLAARALSGWDPTAHLPVLNLQVVIAAAVVVTGWWAAQLFSRRVLAGDPALANAATSRWFIVPRSQPVVCAVITFAYVALSFEVDRMIGAAEAAPATLAWSGLHLRALWLTLFWGGGGVLALLAARAAGWRRVAEFGGLLVCAAALAWLSVDTLGLRFATRWPDVPVILNLQCGVGVALIVMLVALARLMRVDHEPETESEAHGQMLAGMAMGLVALIGLWLGSFEIDRFFYADADLKQTGLSVWWAMYGVALVTIGFVRRVPMSRYFGLGLFAVTLGKVLIVDTARFEDIWRVLSLISVGLLVLATSVAYAKVAPRLLGEDERGPIDAPPAA